MPESHDQPLTINQRFFPTLYSQTHIACRGGGGVTPVLRDAHREARMQERRREGRRKERCAVNATGIELLCRRHADSFGLLLLFALSSALLKLTLRLSRFICSSLCSSLRSSDDDLQTLKMALIIISACLPSIDLVLLYRWNDENDTCAGPLGHSVIY